MVEQWKEGDVVQLKSGSPKMIVDRVVHYSDDRTSVYCIWFEDNKKQEGNFPPSGLEKITEAEVE